MRNNLNAYKVDFNLNSAISQEELSQKLKTNGAEVIQTSSGLCFKTEKNQQELGQIFSDQVHLGIKFQTVNTADKDLAPDVKAFLESEA